MRRIDRLRGREPGRAPSRSSWPLGSLGLDSGPLGMATTWTTGSTEGIRSNYADYVENAYKANGVVFAVILARMLLFTEARFTWQRMEKGRPGALFGTQDLQILEEPWPDATTSTLLAHMEQDDSLAGNAYIARRWRPGGRDQLVRLRPDWVSIVLGSNDPILDGLSDPEKAKALASLDWNDVDVTVAGYLYRPPGGTRRLFGVDDVAHYRPNPDPTARFLGMSWLTPVLEEIRSDKAATRHKGKFFDNAATPNLAVAPKESMTKEQFLELVDAMEDGHVGVENAYRTLWLAYGADVSVVGSDLKQLDFKATQGAGETRIAAAGGVPPVIVGLSEGLQQATYSNYGQARRKMGDHWARPHWRDAAGALSHICPPPAGARLWYDPSDIAFLQEDEQDAATILSTDATSIRQLTDGGYTPESVIAAVDARDLSLLEHTGLLPVQMQPPGTGSTEE